jgi:hypothetical protein
MMVQPNPVLFRGFATSTMYQRLDVLGVRALERSFGSGEEAGE